MVSFENRALKDFSIANFVHPVPKFWLRPCNTCSKGMCIWSYCPCQVHTLISMPIFVLGGRTLVSAIGISLCDFFSMFCTLLALPVSVMALETFIKLTCLCS